MNPIFADTFYYLALVNKNDAFHDRAVWCARNLRVPIVTTAWIITELADALAHRTQRKSFLAILEAVGMDPDVTLLSPSESLYEAGLSLFANRPDKDWSLTDCTSFVVMEQHGLSTALTADQHFVQAGFRALLLESQMDFQT